MLHGHYKLLFIVITVPVWTCPLIHRFLYLEYFYTGDIKTLRLGNNAHGTYKEFSVRLDNGFVHYYVPHRILFQQLFKKLREMITLRHKVENIKNVVFSIKYNIFKDWD